MAINRVTIEITGNTKDVDKAWDELGKRIERTSKTAFKIAGDEAKKSADVQIDSLKAIGKIADDLEKKFIQQEKNKSNATKEEGKTKEQAYSNLAQKIDQTSKTAFKISEQKAKESAKFQIDALKEIGKGLDDLTKQFDKQEKDKTKIATQETNKRKQLERDVANAPRTDFGGVVGSRGFYDAQTKGLIALRKEFPPTSQAAKDLTDKIRDNQAQIREWNQNHKRSIYQLLELGENITVVTAGIVALGRSLLSYGANVLMTGARTEVLKTVLGTVGRLAGHSTKQLDAYTDAVKRMGITTQVSREILTRMIQNKMDLSRVTDFARVAQDAAVIVDENSSEAMNSLIDAVLTRNTLMLRNRGIMIDVNETEREYAKSLGKSWEVLTEAEKQTAIFNKVLEKGKDIAGTYEASMNDVGKLLQSFPRYIEELKNKMSASLLPAFNSVAKLLANFLQNLEKLPSPVLGAIFVIGGLTVAVAGLTTAFAFLNITTGGIIIAVGLWVTAVAGAIFTVVSFSGEIKKWIESNKTLRDTLIYIGDSLRTVQNSLSNMGREMSRLISSSGSLTSVVVTLAAELLKNLLIAIKLVIDGINIWIKTITYVIAKLGDLKDTFIRIKNFITANPLTGTALNPFLKALGKVFDIMSKIKNKYSEIAGIKELKKLGLSDGDEIKFDQRTGQLILPKGYEYSHKPYDFTETETITDKTGKVGKTGTTEEEVKKITNEIMRLQEQIKKLNKELAITPGGTTLFALLTLQIAEIEETIKRLESKKLWNLLIMGRKKEFDELTGMGGKKPAEVSNTVVTPRGLILPEGEQYKPSFNMFEMIQVLSEPLEMVIGGIKNIFSDVANILSVIPGFADSFVGKIVSGFQTAFGIMQSILSVFRSIQTIQEGISIIKSIIPFLAEGGPAQAGKPYIVGEKGMELFIPSQNGNVISNKSSAESLAMNMSANGGRQAPVINVYVKNEMGDMAKVGVTIEKAVGDYYQSV